jgi:putative transposase
MTRECHVRFCEKFGAKLPRPTYHLYRAVDKAGNTIDFLFRAERDKVAARQFFEKAIGQNGSPKAVTIDKSGSDLAALHAVNAERETPIKVRQVKYLNNIVEPDRRAIKRITRPMQGFKDFDCARVILSGIVHTSLRSSSMGWILCEE